MLFLASSLKAQIAVTADTNQVGTYDVYEIIINHPVNYSNNWEDVAINAVFSGPQTINISGFYFDSFTWKVRFAPPVPGNWSYTITFTTPTKVYSYTSHFSCISSANKGFLKRHPNNPFRLIYPDGTLFNGIGLQDCIQDVNADGTPLDDWGFNGTIGQQASLGSETSLSNYMDAYGVNGAGFNLWRWSTDNCSFKLYDSITTTANSYDVKAGMWGDTLVKTLKKNKIRIWLDFFGVSPFGQINGSTPLEETALKKYISYVVARYGAYTDIWELFNESSASAYYIDTITAFIRSIDPYKRLITVSDPQPQLASIDIDAPHWYVKEPELESDVVTVNRIAEEKKFNKPIIFGEQGNSIQNWDDLSAERMRIRSWTAFFEQGIFIFWNTSYIKNYRNTYAANIYLGPQERGYIRALQNFTVLADTGVRAIPFFPDNKSQVRAFGLKSAKVTMGYFHHTTSHTSYVNTSFNYRVNPSGTIYWISPSNGSVIDSAKLAFGTQTISSPQFTADISMLIKLDSPAQSFDTNAKLDILLYPNPASNFLSVDGNFNGTAVLELFNIAGKKVFTDTSVIDDKQVNIQGLGSGIYIYKVSADNRQTTGKVIIN